MYRLYLRVVPWVVVLAVTGCWAAGTEPVSPPLRQMIGVRLYTPGVSVEVNEPTAVVLEIDNRSDAVLQVDSRPWFCKQYATDGKSPAESRLDHLPAHRDRLWLVVRIWVPASAHSLSIPLNGYTEHMLVPVEPGGVTLIKVPLPAGTFERGHNTIEAAVYRGTDSIWSNPVELLCGTAANGNH